MIEASIIFSMRNRAKELAHSLPSMLRLYRDKPIEILCMDDHSTDSTYELAAHLAKEHGWTDKFKLFRSVRTETTYDYTQAKQNNYLAEQAQGKYLIVQSSEVAHTEDCVTTLCRYTSEKQVAFATVYDAPAEVIARLAAGRREYHPGFFDSLAAKQPEAVVWSGESFDRMGGLGYQRIKLADGESLLFKEYTGIHRPVCLFFCGAILKSDWVAMGGYDKRLPDDLHSKPEHEICRQLFENGTDMLFWRKMVREGYRFAFTNVTAVHIEHAKH